jgi:CheY-like chemotaxis protein
MNTKTILIVDDDENTRSLLHHILNIRWNFILQEAGDGKQAMDLINGGLEPDLCIVDLMMPEHDGRSMIEQMNRSLLVKKIKVMTCSAINEYHARQDLMSLGVCGHICKPIEAKEVLDNVARALHLDAPAPVARSFEATSQNRQSMPSNQRSTKDCRPHPALIHGLQSSRLNIHFNN